VPGRKIRPDDFIPPGQPIHLPGQTSGAKGAVYLFHGEEWHGGWPKDHPKYGGINLHNVPYDTLFKLTLEVHELYKKEGYRVFVVWRLHYVTACRAKAPVHIRNVIKEV